MQPIPSGADWIGDIDGLGAPPAMIHVLERCEFRVGENRVRNPQTMCVRLGSLNQAVLGADVTLEGHDDFFANRVDWRVRHLCKALFEVVVNHARS